MFRMQQILAAVVAFVTVLVSFTFTSFLFAQVPQTVYSTDFEVGIDSVWSSVRTDRTPSGRRFLGQFGNQTVRLRLNNLPPHEWLDVAFDLLVIRSWDGNNTVVGPDIWQFSVAGNEVFLRTTFTNLSFEQQAYPDNYPEGNHPPQTSAAEINTLGYTYLDSGRMDSVYHLASTCPHADNAIQLDFSASGLEELWNESWGLDNVRVTLDGVSFSTADFEGAVGQEWLTTLTEVTPAGGRRFLGRFQNDHLQLNLTGLPPHTQVTVAFDLFVIQSWDGNAPGIPEIGPDLWQLDVPGFPPLIRTTFSNHDGTSGILVLPQAFPDAYPGGNRPPRTGAVENNTLGYTFTWPQPPVTLPVDAVYRLEKTFSHSANTLTLSFSASNLQTYSIEDESWGLDNVVVTIQNVPLPPRPPRNLTVTSVPGQSIQLTWEDVSDNETKFIVERKLGVSGWQKLAEVPANTTAYRDEGVPTGELCYRVSAANDVGTSGPTPPVCVTVEPPQPPDTPDNFMATLAENTSILLRWGKPSTQVTKYIIDHLNTQCQWAFLAEVDGNTTSFLHADLDYGQQVCYRVSAANDSGVSTPSDVVCLVVTWLVGPPLKIYVPDANPNNLGRWEDLYYCDVRLRPKLGTAVIVHGWNPPNDLLCRFGLCHWDGDINANPRGQLHWTREVAHQIFRRLNGEINILAWDWLTLATNTLGDATRFVSGQAVQLAKSLKIMLPEGYTYPIHVMGHSLGTLVGSEACLELMEPRQSFPETFRVRQLTLWDPPDSWPALIGLVEVWSDLTDRVQQLRARQVYVDLYAGLTNRGTHFANLVVDVPGDGHDVFNWYRTAIPAGINPRLFVPVNDEVLPTNGTVGFGASVLLPGDPIRPDDACPNGFGMLQFSHPENWTDEFSRDFLLTDYWCATWDEPTRQLIESLNAGSFSGDCDPLRCVNQSPTRIALGTATIGAGAGGGAAELVASYSLGLTVDLTWDYLSFQYQFDAAPVTATLSLTITSGNQTFNVWSIGSDQVVFGEFLDSRRIPVASFQGQLVTIRFDLRCVELGAAVLIQDLTFWQSPTHGNHPPDADAGPDQVVAANPNDSTPVTLDGTKTRDEDGDELSYRWLLAGNFLGNGVQPTVMFPAGNYEITLVVSDPAGQEDRDIVIIVVGNQFIRGDSNTDGGVDISDPINTLGYLFLGTNKVPCEDAADANDDGTLDISDAIFTLGFLFLGLPPIISEPFPNRGQDPTFDNLGCER